MRLISIELVMFKDVVNWFQLTWMISIAELAERNCSEITKKFKLFVNFEWFLNVIEWNWIGEQESSGKKWTNNELE